MRMTDSSYIDTQGIAFDVRLSPLAERIGMARVFDLDHLGAEVGQQPTGEGAGDEASQL
jgi:hypothetical protein